MPLLRKSGVRAPWLPAPLPSPDANPPRRMSVVAGWQPLPSNGAVIVRLTSVRETPIAFTPWARHTFPLTADNLARTARRDTTFTIEA